MAKISIVIPVYNAATYITRCINSILGQTFTAFQVVLVNDGSTDESEAMIKELIQNDPRFVLISKKNGGVSAARNTGLKHVDAEWVTFLDSDDWLCAKYFEALLNASAGNAQIDMVVAGYQRVDNSGAVLYTKNFEQAIVAADDYPTLFNKYHLHDHGYCWAKLFRKDILDRKENWFNTTISLYEDTLFIFEYLKQAKKVCFTDNVYYNYLENQQSITTRKRAFGFSYLPFRALADFTSINFGTGIEMINRRWAIYMNDALISNYTLSEDENERLNNLDKFKPEDWELYKSYFQPFNVFFALFKKLLIKKKFRLADFLMKNYFKLRS
ncbi:MAG: glycosyltransferase family 2 protein [Chryseobacterium sp.]|nr:MAG: glycosyltransferase family 2 protein [Chryseobacterium sp.]